MKTSNQTSWLKPLILSLSIACICLTFPSTASASSRNQPIKNDSCPEGMVFIPGGTFNIGDSEHYPSEHVAQDITVNSFCLDQYEVTNAKFAKFVEETDYITVAERPLSKEQFPALSEAERKPGSLVFQMAEPGAKKIGYLSWWKWTPGTDWRHPFGPESNIQGKENYPVVQVAYQDVEAYAKWAGMTLPTEAQWEYAARGGLDDATYSWGDQYSDKKANTWQGLFPIHNTKADGYQGTAPVGSFEPNGYGLYDITGNVWEWTADWYRTGHDRIAHSINPTGPSEKESFDPREPTVAKHVIKGGSYLCAPNYCSRYRPAARESQSPDTGTTHIGFRLVKAIA